MSKQAGKKMNTAMHKSMAVILAGRRGYELQNLTENRSKAAIPIAGKFKIIDFPLSNCLNSGIRRIGVTTQYKSHTLNQHVQRGWNFLRSDFNEFIELWPAQKQNESESWYQGSADVLYQNLQIILDNQPKYIFLLDGYHIYKQDYSLMLNEHIERGADVSVGCVDVSMREAQRMETMLTDDENRVTYYQDSPKVPPASKGTKDRCLASMGVYIFNAEFLHDMLSRQKYKDVGKELLPAIIEKNHVHAHRFENSCIHNPDYSKPYWRNIESLSDYWAANMDLTKISPELDLYDDDWPIRTMQYQRPAAKFNYNYEERIGTALNSVVSAGCVVSGATVDQSILFNNVKVGSYSKLFKCVVLPRCEINQHCRLNKVVLDQDCYVPDGLVIGEDPELDAKRFYRNNEDGITLVTNDMLKAL